MPAECLFIDSHRLHQVEDRLGALGLGKIVEALVWGANCSVEVVRAKNVTDQQFKPAA